MSVTVRAPAKINLHLGVGAPRSDGFHPLVTVYHAVSLYDDLTATEDDSWSATTDAVGPVNLAGLPDDEDNIAVRAGRLLAQRHGLSRAAALSTYKSIPVAGGMAGGSADAAAALVALDRVWDARTPDDQLLALASRLGSDVPFALVGGTALGTGRGEIVEPWEDNGSWWWVIVPSAEGLSTPAVYRHWDTLFPDASAKPASAHRLVGALKSGEPVRLAAALHNDLQVAAVDLRPDLGALIARGESEGALRGMVSGSGPTCVFLCSGPDEAREVAAALSEAVLGEAGSGGAAWGEAGAVLTAHGPVAGAHVLPAGI